MSRVALLGADERKEGINKAAWKLEDALADKSVAKYPSTLKARELHFQASQAAKEYGKALLAMVALTILESPSWCNNDIGFFSYLDGSKRCTIHEVKPENILLSNLPYIPPGWGIVLELLLIFIISRKFLLERQLQTTYFDPLNVVYHPKKVSDFGLAMCALEVADCLLFAVVRPKFRLAFIARTGYLILLPSVRRLFLCIMAVIWEFLSIAAFYVGTLIFFAWMAVIVFKGLDGEIYGKPINKGFTTFSSTMYTMFVAGSTDEFVSCLLPTYSAFRPSGLLWLSFLIIVQVLLLNLVLDTLVAAYTRYNEVTEEHDIEEKISGINEAFQTLSEATGGASDMSKDVFLEFISDFSKSPNVRTLTERQADIVFKAVDKDGGGSIDKREFFDICAVIQYDFWTCVEDSPVKNSFPGLWNSGSFIWFRNQMHSGGFDGFMNCILLVNLLLVICESVYDLNGWPELKSMQNLELSFSLIYVGEVGLKLCVVSFSEYWALRSNQFDFFTTWMLLASSVLDELATSVSGGNIKRYMNILRLLRLLRVIKQLKRFQRVQLMVETIINLVSASKHIMTLLAVVTFFFSTLSVQLWGGLLYVGNEALEETEYEEKKLFVLNFNDFACSFGVWVVMLLCEYVPDFPEAISKVSWVPGGWLVFLVFYMGGVSIVFELVKAFTIEVFLELHKKWGQPKEEFKTVESVSAEFEQLGLKLHYRIVGDTSGHEKLVKALKEQSEELAEGGEGGHGHGHHKEEH